MPLPSERRQISIYVDEREYTRRRKPQSPSGWTIPNNNIPDWFEKKFWDYICDNSVLPQDSESQASFDLVEDIQHGTVDMHRDQTAGAVSAHYDSSSAHRTIWFNLSIDGFRNPLPAYYLVSYEGYIRAYVPGTQPLFEKIVSHECRHVWQYDLTLRSQGPLADEDINPLFNELGDMLPENPPQSANELRDEGYGAATSGCNPDFDMNGEGEFDALVHVKPAIERDAVRFEHEALGHDYMCAIREPPYLPGGGAAITVPPTESSAVLKALVRYDKEPDPYGSPGQPPGQDPQTTPEPLRGGVVMWTITSGDCEFICGQSACPSSVEYRMADLQEDPMQEVYWSTVEVQRPPNPGACEIEAVVAPPLAPADCQLYMTGQATVQSVVFQ
jgi:hypothetical protein